MLVEKIAKRGKSFTDGELIRECIPCSIDVVFPFKAQNIKNSSLSSEIVVFKIWYKIF